MAPFITRPAQAHMGFMLSLEFPHPPPPQQIIIADTGSPYDFAISPAGTVAYVADDTSVATSIQKWTFNGSTWSQKFTFSTANGLTAGCRGLAVDFSGANPVLYATTADSATKLIKITDTSAFADTSDTADQATTLATAPALTAFSGVALAPTASPVIISQPSDVSILWPAPRSVCQCNRHQRPVARLSMVLSQFELQSLLMAAAATAEPFPVQPPRH